MAVDVSTLSPSDFHQATSSSFWKWTKFAIASIISLIWVVPFYYLFTTIFKTQQEYSQNHPLSLPESLFPFIENAKAAWSGAKLEYAFTNSLFYGVVGAGMAVFLAALASFALTRIDISHKKSWFFLIFAGTIFPFQMYLIPLFFGYQKLGILNSHFGLLMLYIAVAIPFPTLVLRNFMSGISHEIDEAARMDGSTELQVFFRIILPNCKGPLTACFLLQFTWIWNDLLFSTILGNGVEVRSVMAALQVFSGTFAETGPNVMLTAAFLTSLPSVLLFVLLRKYFMEGLRIGSM